MNNMGWRNLSWKGLPPCGAMVLAQAGGGIGANESHKHPRAANLHPPQLTTKHKHTQWTCQPLHVVQQPCTNAMPQANPTTQGQHNWRYTQTQTPTTSI